MIHFKLKSFLICFFLVGDILYSQPKNIQNLSLNFDRTEISPVGTKISLNGQLIYKSHPYIFIFNTLSPSNQFTYQNSDGTFILDDNEIEFFDEGESVLNQTCNSILSWFQSDCNLEATGYKISEIKNENRLIVSKWIYAHSGTHAIESVTVYSDENGLFLRLQMYTEGNVLFTDSELSDFSYQNGFFYPTTITSKTYQNNELYLTTILKFSNVIINDNKNLNLTKNYEQKYNINLSGKAISLTVTDKQVKMNNEFSRSEKPSEKKYNTTLMSVGVNWGFSFYKAFITNQDKSNCPYSPSCSQYMLQSVSKNGVWGIIQGLERLKRCTKFEHSRGFYPVTPEGKHLDPVK